MLLVIVLISILTCGSYSEQQPNNACPTFEDYYTVRNNSKCWFSPSGVLDVRGIIKLYGYPMIEYRIPTKDGFILTVFRIPSNNPKLKKYPVYLQHGLVATCAYFVGLGRNSLAFVLADAGYDVWLGNYRGTQYSEAHMNLTVYDPEYWEHSMDDVVALDFPATFNTILAHSPHGSQIIYIGHSLGTTLSLMYAAEYPEIAGRMMKMMVLISPAYTLTHMKSPYRKAAPFGSAIIVSLLDLVLTGLVAAGKKHNATF